ncbi:MAG TPA: RNA-binding protein [Vicinamibacterales bacterium]|jgi:RNA recognition motif-containing protein|nr:RNA-binding protein [Vicinamibacterales bacterium]
MSSKLYVGNLPYETTETELEGLFAQTGAVASVNVVRDRETGRPRGFAFVEMASEADAKNAIAQLNERPFGGRKLMVNEARPQVPRGGGGGGFRGGDNRGGGGRGGRSEPRW